MTDQSDAQIAEALGVPLTAPTDPVDTAPSNGAEPPIDQSPADQHNTDDLPEWVRDELTRARREAARYRTQAREAKSEAKNGTKEEPPVDRDSIRAEVRKEYANDVAAARLESALTGLVDSPAEFVELLDKSKYVTADGGVDLDKVKALRDKFTRIVTTPSVGHGRNGNNPLRTEADMFADVMNQLGA